jgi:hypothetical protein
MTSFNWESLNKELRGIGLIVAGSILLLHTLGILQKWLNWFLVFFAIVLIIYGFIETGIWRQLIMLIQRKKESDK